MFARFAHRLRSLLSLPTKPQLQYLEARIDNLEIALHRDITELRALVDERAFAMAELVGAGVEQRMIARLDAGLGAQALAAREHAESASSAAAAAAVNAAREHTEAASSAAEAAAVNAAREHAEASVDVYAAGAQDQLARIRNDIARLSRSIQHAAPPVGVAGAAQSVVPTTDDQRERAPVGEIDDLLYLAIEDRFRGDAAVVRERQKRYLPEVSGPVDDEHPLLDLGCGRGEWLQLLAEAGVPARGIDSNESCIAECGALGLDASVGDLVETLSASPDGSFGAITLFHVVEHLPFGVLADVLTECARVLVPGGVLVAETPNALNLRVAATNFWLDPTHVRPLHPQLLRLLAERAGFSRMDDLFLHDLGDPIDVALGDTRVDNWLSELSQSLDGPGDYALVAWTPGPSSP